MNQWKKAIQKMINWIEGNLDQEPTLMKMSDQIGYSPYYCSGKFHEITGMTLRSYIAGRRLSRAAAEIRDTDARILDIALKYGYSSQQALTRAFVYAYRCTPAAYRKNPEPVRFSMKKEVLFPDDYFQKGEKTMSKTMLTEANVRVEYIPAHKFIGISDKNVQTYFDFWEHHNCDEITGTIESMRNVMDPVVECHTGGWFWEDGKRGYFYGGGVAADYSGKVPEGFEIISIPGSYYLVFYHPPFDFLKDCEEVITRVEDLAWNYDPSQKGFKWNETECRDYQRMASEVIGCEVLRPVKKL